MTKHERVMSTIQGKPCDRIPFSFWCHLPDGVKSGREAVQVQAQFYRDTDIDFIKMMIDGFRDITQGQKVQVPEDWDRLRLPEMDSDFVTKQLDMIQDMVGAIHDEAPVLYHMFSPFSVMRMIWGHDIVYAHLRDLDARAHILGALNAITKFQAEAAYRYLDGSPAAGIMVTLSGAEQDGVGRAIFEDIVRPSDMAVLQAVKKSGKLSSLHLCGWGKRPNHMEFWKDYPTDIMDYDTADDHTLPLKDAGSFFVEAKSVMGGFGCRPEHVLFSCQEDEVVRHTRKCAAEGGRKAYFVGAGSSFLPGVIPNERFRLVGDTLKAEGCL